mmetsp:Transcript_62393/g.97103  ORF Transcript_62393/g.97103 Transcript_62393/m.97103 type:complete len:856 (-) Transcript_62393:93-2660(-)
MGNGAMLRQLRSPRRPGDSSATGGQVHTPVVGRACENGPSRVESSAVSEPGVARVLCSRCNVARALPYGTVAFTCAACGSDVRVSLNTMSVRAKADARTYLQKADGVMQAILSDAVAHGQELWTCLKKIIREDEPPRISRSQSAEASQARAQVRTAVENHELDAAFTMLLHWEAQGLPLLSDKIRVALANLREQDERQTILRCMLRAVKAADRADLEFWRDEGRSNGLCIPEAVIDAIHAVQGEERASRAESEYQELLKSRVEEAVERCDSAALKALAMEARLLGEDSTVVDAALPLKYEQKKSYRPKRSASHDCATRLKASDIKEEASCQESNPLSRLRPSEIKDELAKRGISAVGVVEKEELINLLMQGKQNSSAASADTDDPFDAPFKQAPPAPATPRANRGNIGAMPSTKPPVGPRMRTTLNPAAFGCMPSNDDSSRRASLSSATDGTSWPGMPPTTSYPSKPSVASSSIPSTTEVPGPRQARSSSKCSWAAYSSESTKASHSSPPPAYVPGNPPVPPCSHSPPFAAPLFPNCSQSPQPKGGFSFPQGSPQKPCENSFCHGGTPSRSPPSVVRAGREIGTGQRSARSSGVSEGSGNADAGPFQRMSRPSSAKATGSARSTLFEEIFGNETKPIRVGRPASASPKPGSHNEGLGGVESSTPCRIRPSSASARPQSQPRTESPQPNRPPSPASRGDKNTSPARARVASFFSNLRSNLPSRPSSPSAKRSKPTSPTACGPSMSSPRASERRSSRRHASMPPRPPSPRAPQAPLPPRPVSPTRTRASALMCLGLTGNPSKEELRRAYKQAAMLWHPDRPQNHSCAEEAKHKFQDVKAAFDLLQNSDRRFAAAGGG